MYDCRFFVLITLGSFCYKNSKCQNVTIFVSFMPYSHIKSIYKRTLCQALPGEPGGRELQHYKLGVIDRNISNSEEALRTRKLDWNSEGIAV